MDGSNSALACHSWRSAAGGGHRAPNLSSTRGAWTVRYAVLMTMSGCSAAPSQNILGSFFPAWLLCAALGVVAAVICWRLLVAARISEYLIAPPLVYLAIAASVTLLIWLVRSGG